MSIHGNPQIIKSNLILCLDATNLRSYPGSGTVWYDLSGNGNNFNINASAPTSSGFMKYMDFNGSYGIAKNTTGTDISLSDSTGVTYFMVTRIKNSSADWRTLTRSWSSDHQVIILSGGWEIGMYDNDGSGFIGTGYSQQSLPNYNTSNWIIIYWRWQSTSPYYQFGYNDTPGAVRGSLTNVNSRYNRGFGALGGYHNGSTDVNNSSQYWGDIAYFSVYNKFMADDEVLQNYFAIKSRFNL
jgi:hypothetical protein